MDLELIDGKKHLESPVLCRQLPARKSQISSGAESKNKNWVVTIRTVERWKRNLQMELWLDYEKMDCENVSALKCKVCIVQDIRNDQNVCILCFRS